MYNKNMSYNPDTTSFSLYFYKLNKSIECDISELTNEYVLK